MTVVFKDMTPGGIGQVKVRIVRSEVGSRNTQIAQEMLKYDKFGEETKMLRIDDKTICATVTIQNSPTFWGWLFQFGGEMTIDSPETLKKEYGQRVAALLHNKGDE